MSLIYKGGDALEIPAVAEALDDVTVRSWDEHGLRFTNAEGGIRKLPRTPSIVTLHWTGGNGDASRVFRTLRHRKTRDGKGLSVQLFIDAAGVLWQFADLADRARHASGANKYGPGIEIQGLGLDRVAHPAAQDAVIHGRAHRVLPFTEPQFRTVVAVSKALAALCNLPRAIPGNGGAFYAGLLTRDEIANFSGVLGHLHVSEHKLDPGIEVFRRLEDAGFAPTS